MKIKSLKSSLQLLVLFFIAMHFASCLNYKKVPYFTDIPQRDTSASILNPYVSPLVQRNDILGITVSSISPETNALFSFNNSSSSGSYSTGSTYMVDMDGNITVPLVGKIMVEGLSTQQIRDFMALKLEPYLKEPVVEVRINNFRIVVLGAVSSPGLVSSNNERMTLMDAISLAGDLSLDARRDNVLLVREEKGVRKQIRFNLNSSEMLNSPYYYMRSNDIIYVQPGRSGVRELNFRNVTYLFAIISIAAFVQSFLK
jgi:polysaccharide export outer membrane protein